MSRWFRGSDAEHAGDRAGRANPPSVGKRTLIERSEAAPTGTATDPSAPDGENGASVQRATTSDGAATIAPSEAPAVAHQGVATAGGAIPHAERIQQLFGRHEISSAKAQVGGPAAAACDALGASAYTQGDRVGFASPPDLHTAAHEAAHVVQQRGGVQLMALDGGASDPHEPHADAVADAVVAGESAEALLDNAPGAASGAASSAAVQRKKEPKKPPTRAELRGLMERYLAYNHRDVWRSVGTHIRSVTLPTPHERLDWRVYGAFVTKLLMQLETHLGDFTPLIKLDDALYPSDTEGTIGAILPTKLTWSGEIGMAVAHALHIAIVASIKRLAVRYLQVADSKGVAGEDRVLYTELVTSMPIDRFVGVALCWGSAVTVKPLDPKAAKAAKGKQVGLKKVSLSYPFAHGHRLWNWVRVDSPSDATTEDVAAALFMDDRGDPASSAAFMLAAAPPLFGVPKRLALTNPDLKQNAPPNVNAHDDSVDKQLLQIASTGPQADEAALKQQGAPGPRPPGAPPQLGKVLDALRDCSDQLEFTRKELAAWDLEKHLSGAEAFLQRKQAEVPTLEQNKLADWAPVIDGQKDRLVRIAGGIHAVIAAAAKLGIKDPKSDHAAPLREILGLFAVAAGTSHMAQTSEAKLLQALQQQNVLTLRALQATERNMMSGLDQLHQGTVSDSKVAANIAATGHQAVALQERSLRLQTQLANGGQIDPDALEEVSMKSEEVALESRLLGTLLTLADLNKAAREAGSGDAAIIASLFSGAFRDLPALTKHIFEELNPVRNNLVIHRKSFDEEERANPSPGRKKYLREQRRKSLNDAQDRFQKLAIDRDLNEFFSNAAELIKNQQFRAACVKVAAMIGISLVAGVAAGLAARAVGGVLLEATGATAVSELGMAARAGIAITRIGVDTTISSAGTVAVQGGSFDEVWKENLITTLASSALFGSISRYAAEQAQLEGRIALTWSKATKLGKLGMIGKEVGAITAHTLWGAAMGQVAGRIVTGQSQPPPETLQDWALQGISVAVGRHVSNRLTTNSKLYKRLEQSAENAGRGLVVTAAKLGGLAKRAISGKQPAVALELLNEHDKFMRRELEAIERAVAKTGDPTGELSAAHDRIKAAAEAVGSQGMLETKFTLLGMEELVPGALWKGTKEQIQQAMKQAETDGQKPKVLGRDETSKRWKLKIGDRTLEVQEVVSTAKTVNAERLLVAGSDEELRMAAKLVVPKPGSVDIIVHGGVDDFMVTINGNDYQISHRSLAKYIKSTGIKFKRVRLLACKAGMHPKGVAQHLANKLGVTVEAPSDNLYIHPDGSLTIGPHETRNTGKWEEFSPKPSESRYTKAPDPDRPAAPQHDANEPHAGSAPDRNATELGNKPKPKQPTVPVKRADKLDESNVEDVIAQLKSERKLSPDEEAAIRRQAKNKGEKWNLDDKLRGEVAHVLAGENLKRSFPVIDRVDGVTRRGIAKSITSVKTHQLYTDTFKQPGAFLRKLTTEIDALAAFTRETYAGKTVKADKNTTRTLEVEVPPNTLSSTNGGDEALRKQWREEAQKAEAHAKAKGVKLVFRSTK